MWNKLKPEHLLVPLILTFAVLVKLSFQDTLTMEQYLENWTYGLLSLVFALFCFALIPFLRKIERSQFRLENKAFQSGLVGVLFAGFLFYSTPPSFKLFADESNLISVSQNLYKTKKNYTTEGQISEHGNTHTLRKVLDKRPVFFSFLLSIVHTLKGYSSANSFILNGFFCAAFTALLYYVFSYTGSSALALAAVFLFFASPNIVMTVCSGDFSFFLYLMLLFLTFLLNRYRKHPSQELFFLFWISSILTIHTRYEAFLFVALLWSYAFYKRHFNLKLLNKNRLLIVLSFFLILPLLWQQSIFWLRWGGGFGNYNQDLKTEFFGAFSYHYFWVNLKDYLTSVYLPFRYGAYASLLYWISIILLILWLILRASKAALNKVDDDLNHICWMMLGLSFVHFLTFMFFLFGEASYPSTTRFHIGSVGFLALMIIPTYLKVFDRKYIPYVSVASLLVFLSYLPMAQTSSDRNAIYDVKTYSWFMKYHSDLIQGRNLLVHNPSVDFLIEGGSVFSQQLFFDLWADVKVNISQGNFEKVYFLETVSAGQKPLGKVPTALLNEAGFVPLHKTGLSKGVKAYLFEVQLKPEYFISQP